MNPLRVKIIKLGTSRYSRIWKFVNRIKNTTYSKLFIITDVSETALPDADHNYSYSVECLSKKITVTDKEDLSLGFMDQPFDDDCFANNISYKKGIVSLSDVDSIFADSGVNVENFFLIMIYMFIITYYIEDDSGDTLCHDDTRSCLFDMCGNKEDIIQAATSPCICYACESALRESELPMGLLDTLKKELKRIKKHAFYRIKDWVTNHPILSLLITFVSTIAINVLSSFLYDFIV
ncbi:MAG: hypothetical protein LBM28_01375 [Oscillospiraceae bacterium]|jgi:hypothetical protein|nr:hypothetical protein [Oscillospiraceae bacterium]